jgi:hypothetical protein
MADVGRPTKLDDEFYLKIKGLVLEGKSMTEVAEALEVPYKTIESWKTRNYQGFSDRYDGYKREWLLKKAEENIPVLLDSEDEKVMADMTKFVAETLGKQNYSKRSEFTGPDGQPIPILASMHVSPHLSHTQNSQALETDSGSSRRDSSEQDNLDTSIVDERGSERQEADSHLGS